MKARPAALKRKIQAKKLGMDRFKDYHQEAACVVERHGTDHGVLVLWFPRCKPGAYYAKINAIEAPDTIEYTDGKAQL